MGFSASRPHSKFYTNLRGHNGVVLHHVSRCRLKYGVGSGPFFGPKPGKERGAGRDAVVSSITSF
jgi:hypothetical protein